MGKGMKLRNLKFLVRWLGYGPESDTWQSWGTLRNTPQIRSFLEKHTKKAYLDLVNRLPSLTDIEGEESQEEV